MLRTSQKPQEFSVEQFNLQAPDRRSQYRKLNAQGVINRRRAKRIQKWMDTLMVVGCIVVGIYVAQDITRQAYEQVHHHPLSWAIAQDYVVDFLNIREPE
jgi:hypothetical protein